MCYLNALYTYFLLREYQKRMRLSLIQGNNNSINQPLQKYLALTRSLCFIGEQIDIIFTSIANCS